MFVHVGIIGAETQQDWSFNKPAPGHVGVTGNGLGGRSLGQQEVERRDSQPSRQSLYRLERQVPLPSLDAAHVGAMHVELVGERPG